MSSGGSRAAFYLMSIPFEERPVYGRDRFFCAVSQWLACCIVHVLGDDVGVQCTRAWGLAVVRCLAARARPCEIYGCTDLLGHQFTTHVCVAGDIRVSLVTSKLAYVHDKYAHAHKTPQHMCLFTSSVPAATVALLKRLCDGPSHC